VRRYLEIALLVVLVALVCLVAVEASQGGSSPSNVGRWPAMLSSIQ